MEATTAQKDYILSLVKKHEVPKNILEYVDQEWHLLTKRDASALIDTIKTLPKKPAAASAGASFEKLLALPKSKYAIPTGLVAGAVSENVDDMLFIEIRTYMERTYMRRLHGSMGEFRRTRLSRADESVIVGVLSADPVRFITEFGKRYACCGKCGSPLTDEKSRARFLGPDCAKALGVL